MLLFIAFKFIVRVIEANVGSVKLTLLDMLKYKRQFVSRPYRDECEFNSRVVLLETDPIFVYQNWIDDKTFHNYYVFSIASTTKL